MNPDIRDRRKVIRKELVLATLATYSMDDVFDVSGIKNSLLNKTGLSFSENDIVNILDDLILDDTIFHQTGKRYCLKSEIEYVSFDNRFDFVWNEFASNFLKKHYSDFDPYLHKNVRTFLEDLILEILQRFSIDDLPVNNQSDALPMENIEPVIDEKIRSNIFQKFLENPLKRSVIEYLSSDENNEELHKFIFDCYYSLINIHIIKTEQDIPDLDFCNEIKFFLLDTSFIIPLLCQTDPKHTLSYTIIEFCRDKNVNIFFSEKTKTELNSLILNLNNPHKRANQRSSLDNQFIQDFLKQSEEGISWEEYFTGISYWKKELELRGISEIKSNDKIIVNQNVSKKVTENLRLIDSLEEERKQKLNPQHEYRIRSPFSNEHDGYCVGLVYHCKFVHYNSERIGPLFLTYDNRLAKINEILNESDKFGVIIQPRSVLNYILAFSPLKIDEKNQEKVGSALLRYTARLQHSQLTLDEYLKLFSVRTGLESKNIEVLKRVIVETPLIDEINKALRENNEFNADDSIINFVQSNAFQEKIDQVIKSDDEKINLQKDKDRLIKLLKEEKEENIAISKKKNTVNITNITHNYYSNYNFEFNSQVDSKILNQFNLLMEEILEKSLLENDILEIPNDKISTKIQLKKWIESSLSKIKTIKNTHQDLSYLIGIMDLILGMIGS
ncbi:hypothetical protein [Methanogenium sp. MK-MG]|uniref:hypothetical protein n=1 Tax=Methanogenium sp. MK-MG TaxID=2599926 RepID=UPI0013EB3FDA|nr:hypothetical protein [Methanogenium sp. MK-MG]